jgi:hypothetical protein
VRARAKKRALSAADTVPKSTTTARAPFKKGRSAGAALAILETAPLGDSLASVIARLHGGQINGIIKSKDPRRKYLLQNLRANTQLYLAITSDQLTPRRFHPSPFRLSGSGFHPHPPLKGRVGVESCPHAPRNITSRILGRAARRAHDLILTMTVGETKGNGLPALGRSLIASRSIAPSPHKAATNV